MSLLNTKKQKLCIACVFLCFGAVFAKEGERAGEVKIKVNVITQGDLIEAVNSLSKKMEDKNTDIPKLSKKDLPKSALNSLFRDYYYVEENSEKDAIMLKIGIETAFFHHYNIVRPPTLTYFEQHKDTMNLRELVVVLRFVLYLKQEVLKDMYLKTKNGKSGGGSGADQEKQRE